MEKSLQLCRIVVKDFLQEEYPLRGVASTSLGMTNIMKILLLGKNGQLGHELEQQAKTFAFSCIAYGHESLDITDYQKVRSELHKHKPNFVLNASAYHVVPECEIYPEIAFKVNALAIKNLAEVCEEIGSQLVHYSTDYVFDGKKGSQYEEDDTPYPMQAYGISKVAGEHFALAYNTNSIVIRASGVYGGKSGSRSKKGNFVVNILKEKEKRTLEVSSEQIVNPTYAVDLAEATYKLIQQKEVRGVYHLANEGICSWAEFTQEIMKAVGSKTKVIPVDRRGNSGGAKRPLFSALRNTRAKKLGVVLPKWQDGVRRYLESI